MIGFRNTAASWLAIASLVFYGWSDPLNLIPLLLISIVCNYLIGLILIKARSYRVLWIGVCFNLFLLGFFKYFIFIYSIVSTISESTSVNFQIDLPIGISFFTFTQIAFLVDAYRGETRETHPLHYLLFVTYFPHLIAGPILHHKEMMPQFARLEIYTPSLQNISIGLSWFSIGLFKKSIIADSISIFVGPVFNAGATGSPLLLSDSWIGAIAYTFQIYFDFSGYSDMAFGLAAMMGIRFPFNFSSPYKSTSIIEFWRRWHITLSRFLRDYLYFSLGGNRKGHVRRHINLLITMVLGGLWHGASWNFVVWGIIHGLALLMNHLWRDFVERWKISLPPVLGWLFTGLVVVIAWVPFRADTLVATTQIWRSMFAMTEFGDTIPLSVIASPVRAWAMILALVAFSTGLPNTQELMAAYDQQSRLRWQPTVGWAIALGMVLALALTNVGIQTASEFLYFRF